MGMRGGRCDPPGPRGEICGKETDRATTNPIFPKTYLSDSALPWFGLSRVGRRWLWQ
ncbi:hypothetical protein PILCRDRAFT_815752 [Piloderma croceum F 1598]|uniref:Uncharacterized protein n=1 Tax=Piloderma croceum (strain F 1598) TaxID=765440 RepID=A0A0C3FQU0_PILCF|nr:hypothetical protein PILCRDRAFT_815752 [Piloderma croceum F 1598]